MSPVSQLSVLAFASTVLAVPGYRDFGHKHQYGHNHGHHSSGAGTGTGAPFPYSLANATSIYGSTGFGSGTAAPTGYASSSVVASSPAAPTTVYVSPIPASYSAPIESASSASSASSVSSVEDAASTSECTTDVTVTSTERTYVTVTATSDSSSSSVEVSATQGSSSSSSVRTTYTITKHSTYYYTPSSSSVESTSLSSSSSEAAPVTSSSSSSAAAYTPSSSSSSTEVSPVTTSASSSSTASLSVYSDVNKAPAPSAYSSTTSSASSSVAPSAYSSAAASSTSSTATSSSASATPSSYSSGSGKRGIAYNVTDNANTMISAMSGSQVSWAYNWLSADAGIASGVNYIPMMHAPEAPFSGWWAADAQTGIDNGAEYLFSFNEPDQSGLQPQDVANDWNTYMAPFNGKVKMTAPSVTNGGSAGWGLDWLSSFMGYCEKCQIDAVNIHWYNPLSMNDFKDHVTAAINITGTQDMPVFVTEFGLLDGASDEDIATFLQDVMPWMDSNPHVIGYSYFMAYDSLLLSGDSVSSPVGTTFMSYTS